MPEHPLWSFSVRKQRDSNPQPVTEHRFSRPADYQLSHTSETVGLKGIPLTNLPDHTWALDMACFELQISKCFKSFNTLEETVQ